MEKGFENFNALGAEAAETVVSATDEKKAAKKAKMVEMANALKTTINEDPSFAEKLRTLSNSLSVVNTLGYGDSGNIVVDPNKKGSDDRANTLVQTSQIVGYRVQNTGSVPVKYVTEEYAQDATGVWVGTKVEKTLEPGGIADFTRKYMTVFCSQPEISFSLANGKIVRGSSVVKPNDLDGELEAYYFIFADKTLKVNSDEIKLNVAKAVKTETGKKWVVKDEFAATFGYLNNEKPSGKKPRAKSGSKFTTQDMAANYIQKLLSDTGKM